MNNKLEQLAQWLEEVLDDRGHEIFPEFETTLSDGSDGIYVIDIDYKDNSRKFQVQITEWPY